MTPSDHSDADLARAKSAIRDLKDAYDRRDISATNLDRAMRGLAPIDEPSAGVLIVDESSSDDIDAEESDGTVVFIDKYDRPLPLTDTSGQ